MLRLLPLMLISLAAAPLPTAAAENLPPLEVVPTETPSELLPPWEGEASSDTGLPPLRQRIDELIALRAAEAETPLAEPADDAELMRRLHLDLLGRIPSGEEARRFLADTRPDKRQRLVDELLARPEHWRRMQHVFDTMLMHRLPAKHVKQNQWREYLYRSFRENKPWDQLARELLSADGQGEQRAAARFLLDRELKQEATTRDIGRVFLGRDLQCAQCHDHPHLGDYLQQHYYGIAAFLNRSYLFTDPKTKLAAIGEKAEGAVKFTSVFTGSEGETPPQILDLPPIADPPPDKEPYVAKPDKKTRGVPKYSRRKQLAAAVTDADNRAFRVNIANRLWALMMGRGLSEPVDMLHRNADVSHPQLLRLLADEVHEAGYDIRRTLREIALSRTYQASSRAAGGNPSAAKLHAAALLKPLTPEQLAWSVMEATGVAGEARERAAQQAAAKTKAKSADGDEAAAAVQVERATAAAVEKHVQQFVAVFASGNELSRFDATAGQALFLRNGALLSGWLTPSGDNLVARLAAHTDDRRLAEELYLCVLSRRPSEPETQAVGNFLSGGGSRLQAIQSMVRALVCSAEFRFNH